MTEDTTEIIATYPIYKPFRRINFNFKANLRKHLEAMQPNFLARRFPKFLARFFGREFNPVVEELNQFVFLSMESSTSTYENIMQRERIEHRLNGTYADVSKKTLDRLEDVIRSDPEFEASFKAIKDIADKTDVILETEMILLNNLAKSVRDQIAALFSQSQMIMWDLPGDQIDRIILGGEVVNVEVEAQFDIANVADELALASLAKHHVPLIAEQMEIIHESIMELPKRLQQYRTGFNNFTDEKEQNLVIELASIFLGKLLGIREPLQLAQKQLHRYLRLQEDISEEAEETSSEFIVNLYNRMVSEDQISQSLQLSEEIMDALGDNSDKIRKLYTRIEDAKPTGKSPAILQDFAQFVGKIYHDLEDFRFITDVFQDIPSFTSMSGGVAIGSAGDEEISLPDGDWVIYAENIFKTFPLATTTVYALRGMDLKVKNGEFLAIMGPSGSGKTTLLNILSGLEDPDRGTVIVGGLDLINANEKDLVEFRRDTIAFIYQAYNLLPNLKNKENVQLPADLGTNKDIGKKGQRSAQLMEDVGLGDYLNGFPLRLSGGQQQRVTIARALMNQPDIIFADEPTGDLDTLTGSQVLDVLEQFHDQGVTIVVVTHDKNVAARADRIIHMTDGKILSKEEARL